MVQGRHRSAKIAQAPSSAVQRAYREVPARGGSCEVVCVSPGSKLGRVPPRGAAAPDVATAHKVCACESQPRTLQRRLTPPHLRR